MTHEREPSPRNLEDDIAAAFTTLFELHAGYVHEVQPMSDLTGQILLLRSPSGCFYMALRVTRLNSEGIKAMDTIDVTAAGGDRFLHDRVVQYVRREYFGANPDDELSELIIATRTSPQAPESSYQIEAIDVKTLDRILLDLKDSEPMQYQLPY